MRRAAGALVLALLLGGCTLLEPPRCPPGQERLRTAQLFFGRDVAGKPMVSEVEFRKFVDEVLTPRFPDGLTILDGGGQWKGAQNRLIRESAKVVIIVLPKGPDANERLNVVRAGYKQRFNQESVLQVTQPACVAY